MKSWQQRFSIQKRLLESSAQVGTAMLMTLPSPFTLDTASNDGVSFPQIPFYLSLLFSLMNG